MIHFLLLCLALLVALTPWGRRWQVRCFSNSNQKTENLTQTKTTTSSQVHDIGLTGNAAVALANTLAGATTQGLSAVQTVSQQSGDNFNQLVGGAGLLTQTAGAVAQSGQQANTTNTKTLADLLATLSGNAAATSQQQSATLADLFAPVVSGVKQQISNAQAVNANALTTASNIATTALQGAQPASQNSKIVLYVVVALVGMAFFLRGKR